MNWNPWKHTPKAPEPHPLFTHAEQERLLQRLGLHFDSSTGPIESYAFVPLLHAMLDRVEALEAQLKEHDA